MFPITEFGVLLARLERELQIEDGLWTLRGFVDTGYGAACVFVDH